MNSSSLQPTTTVHPVAAFPMPAIVAAAGTKAALRFLEFFAANIRNPHTRRAYGRAVAEFLAWCNDQGVTSVAVILLLQRNSVPSSHMRCRTTARRLATATMARRMPRRWATRMPHAFSHDHFCRTG
jgi:NhaP-type Na+/H+ or K+/H+ antiporter